MNKITFVLGGARSGKSSYALDLAKKQKGKIAFLATCQALDKEMEKRIALHKNSRPSHWQSFEEPRDIEKVLRNSGNSFDLIIIDCLTLWVSNLLLARNSQAQIEAKIGAVLSAAKKVKAKIIFVANEVGLGIVPANKLGRDFRDIAGKVNQITAKNSDRVFFMVSGIPWRIK